MKRKCKSVYFLFEKLLKIILKEEREYLKTRTSSCAEKYFIND